MFRNIIIQNLHRDSNIGVIGSGPSLKNYSSNLNSLTDILIACNGSIQTLNPKSETIDYYLNIDFFSPNRNWFKRGIQEFQEKSGYKLLRLMPSYLFPFADNLHDSNRKDLIEDLLLDVSRRAPNIDIIKDFISDYVDFIDSSEYNINNELKLRNTWGSLIDYFRDYKLPKDVELKAKPIYIKKFSPNLEGLNLDEYYGSTVTAVGLQIAKYMGASKINLFGCDFSNLSGSNYSYNSKGVYGKTSNEQAEKMDLIINKLISENPNIDVSHYGKTNLKSVNQK